MAQGQGASRRDTISEDIEGGKSGNRYAVFTEADGVSLLCNTSNTTVVV